MQLPAIVVKVHDVVLAVESVLKIRHDGVKYPSDDDRVCTSIYALVTPRFSGQRGT